MLTTAAALLLSSCVATFALRTETHTNITITTGRPRDCQDLIQLGRTYEGHCVVYPESSAAPNKPNMIYCAQDEGMEPLPSDREPARNCLDLLQDGITSSGVNVVYPYLDHPADPVLVLCDQVTDGGGWAVIQNRYDGSEDFYRGWVAYEEGFGNVAEEHYLGNDKISALTGQCVNELLVELEDWNNVKAFAHYQFFNIDADSDYQLQVLYYDGPAGDSLAYHNGRAFTTFDADHDASAYNCAESRHGAWWYWGCCASNLNGYYYNHAAGPGGASKRMYWDGFSGGRSLKATSMKIRPYRGLHEARDAAGH